ncbi:hypothetical protein HELRODRAFT_130545, partial [Helobdella robusta]|uniref:GPI ethanolamine phosphate transferase 3, catalytic subunit n=1 Tax=Helobdella robusta TaxID=6412 RepID=T1EHU2_HELRO
LYIIGILIFTSGFLLRRTVVEETSKCSSSWSPGTSSFLKSHCGNSGKFSKAVLLIIDALRYDFLTFNDSSEVKLNLPYQNNFNHVNSLLKSQPNNAKLFKFVADPPTTTLQRLKGLTTGSLPTFVDAGSNFNKEEITEDNFIDQLVHNNKSIAFVGDDTWMGLFPNRFSDVHSFPSFNVKDLDTVDNGVIENFDRLIRFTNWTLLVGHMLGIDHCGHTFGPHHIKMKEKLIQMDNFIRNITESLNNDTILFVMGDHGMTKTGDHGGDSDEEVDAGLFVYSKLPFSRHQNKISTISQVDLVPTFSLLLGLPIPYQNLGIVIPELFPSEDDNLSDDSKHASSSTEFQALVVLYANAEQIADYVEKYLNISGSSPKLQELLISYEKLKADCFYFIESIRSKHHVIDNAKMKKLIKNLLKFMTSVRNVLKEQWAKFDTTLMFIGILFIILTVLLNLRNVPTDMIIALLLLASQHFYSVGHHPTISSIKWDSVYYILEGDNNPHLLISLILYFNTFAPHIIVALSLPLFIYWPLTNNATGSRAGSKKQSEVESVTDATVRNSSGSDATSNDGHADNIKGEYVLNDDNEKTRSLFHQLCFKAILFLSLKVLAMMLCVTIHRRHLMVWKIFAPRFIYEIAGFLVFSITIIFDYLFLLRTKRAVDRFVNKI